MVTLPRRARPRRGGLAGMSPAAAIGSLLVLAAALGWAQPQDPRRHVMVYFEEAPQGALPRGDFVFLYETLLARLQRASVAVVEADDAAVPPSDDGRGAKASERGADGWIRVVVSREGDGLSAAVSGADLRGGTTVAASTLKTPAPSGADLFPWDDLAALVAAAFPPGKEQGPVASTAEIAVEALPGTAVAGLSEEPLEIGPDGTAHVSVVRPGFYRLDARRDGALPAREDLYLSVADATIEVPQAQAPRWLFEGYTLNLSYFGGSAGRLFGPLYVRLGLTTYILAPWLRNQGEDETAANLPLTELVAGFGYAPTGHDTAVRPYVDAALEARFMHTSHVFALEPVAPFAFRAAAGVEVRGSSRVRAFADWGPVAYDVQGADEATVEATITVDGERGGGYFYKPWWGGVFEGVLIDFVSFRLGLRWYK